jgi:NTP pyrophosphatase (non-canonical NTP hydrolase)
MGISSEYEDMAKKNPKLPGDLEDQREEIDSLVLQLSTICNQACEELQIEYNNIKKKKL